jgi:hypothetical protein
MESGMAIKNEMKKKLISISNSVLIASIQVKMAEIKFIYRCSWFKNKRHTTSHTDMCFERAEHVQWVFDTYDYCHGLARVEYIMVFTDMDYWKSAVANSNIEFCSESSVRKAFFFKN